jgi:hypothetical protein
MRSSLYGLMRFAPVIALFAGSVNPLFAQRTWAQTPAPTPAPVIALQERETSQLVIVVALVLLAAVVIAILAYIAARRRRATSTN